MIDPLSSSLKVASAGLEVQSSRIRVATENVANSQSTGATPGSDPYARKTITFENALNRAEGVSMPRVRQIGTDEQQPFRVEFDPSNPAADAKGYVKMPNVDVTVELSDLREANRSYQANLQTYRQAKELVTMTLDLLKG